MKTPILGSTYVARSVNAADARMVNLFPEVIPEGGKDPGFLQRCPGLRLLNTIGDGPIRCRVGQLGERRIGLVHFLPRVKLLGLAIRGQFFAGGVVAKLSSPPVSPIRATSSRCTTPTSA